jgi:hypothetical protein
MKQRQEECPHCGATFPAGRPACPECGSDHSTGWQDAEDLDLAAVELPDHPEEEGSPARGVKRGWLILAVVLIIVAFALLIVRV